MIPLWDNVVHPIQIFCGEDFLYVAIHSHDNCSIQVSVIWIFLGQKVLFPMDLNRGTTIIDLFGRGADKLLIDFGRREDSKAFLCSVLYFFFIRHGHKGGGKTYDPGKEETKKARKTTTQRKRTSVGVTEDLRLNVAEILQSIELAPETRRSCKEEINC